MTHFSISVHQRFSRLYFGKVVAYERWLLTGGGRKGRFDCNWIAELKEVIAVMSEKITVMSLDKFGLERFSNNPEQIQFYTGFSSYELLKSVFIWLEPSAKNMSTWF